MEAETGNLQAYLLSVCHVLGDDGAGAEAELAAGDVGVGGVEVGGADLAPGALEEELQVAELPVGDLAFVHLPEEDPSRNITATLTDALTPPASLQAPPQRSWLRSRQSRPSPSRIALRQAM